MVDQTMTETQMFPCVLVYKLKKPESKSPSFDAISEEAKSEPSLNVHLSTQIVAPDGLQGLKDQRQASNNHFRPMLSGAKLSNEDSMTYVTWVEERSQAPALPSGMFIYY